MNNSIMIEGISVRQHNDGNFCLNDLQRAAVANPRETRSSRSLEVYEFMRRVETLTMIDLLEKMNFKNIELRKDIYGNDRMIFANR